MSFAVRARKLVVCFASMVVLASLWAPASAVAATATDETLIFPEGMSTTLDGGVLISDTGRNRILKVSSAGIATVVAGTGVPGYSGDGGPATEARITQPQGVAVLPAGGFLIAESSGGRVRRVSPDGTITTVAGGDTPGYSGDGGPATEARLLGPEDAAPMPDGSFVIADTFNNRIRRVFPNGTITTIAGTGTPGYSGDGGHPTLAQINRPEGIAVTPGGSILIADGLNHRIRSISPNTGVITTIAGTGTPGYSGDGGPASAAELFIPEKITATRDGGYVIADTCNHALRKVSRQGNITTIAGTGLAGYSGDGGPAPAARLYAPQGGVAILGSEDRGYFVSDTANHVVRRVSPGGVISTVAGRGVPWSAPERGGSELACPNQLLVPLSYAIFSSTTVAYDILAGGPGGGGGGRPLAPCSLERLGTQTRDTDESMPPTYDGDAIWGRGGNDELRGGAGDDCIYGGRGDDGLRGDAGDDTVRGSPGRDWVRGNSGEDVVRGDRGPDRVSGGVGDDRISGGAGRDWVRGNGGADRVSGGAGNDRISGGAGKDRIRGGAGNDRINAVDGERDVVSCDHGRRDIARADPIDRVGKSCDRVRIAS